MRDLLLLFVTTSIIMFFPLFIQSLWNVITLAAIVAFVCLDAAIWFSLEFFPLFVLLVYIGAIMVSTLFVVLSFSFRHENKKGVFREDASDLLKYVAVLFSALVAVFSCNWTRFSRATADHTSLIDQLISREGISVGSGVGARTAASNLAGGVNRVEDMWIISSSLYSKHWLLFLVLGAFLSLSLIAALAIIREGCAAGKEDARSNNGIAPRRLVGGVEKLNKLKNVN